MTGALSHPYHILYSLLANFVKNHMNIFCNCSKSQHYIYIVLIESGIGLLHPNPQINRATQRKMTHDFYEEILLYNYRFHKNVFKITEQVSN